MGCTKPIRYRIISSAIIIARQKTCEDGGMTYAGFSLLPILTDTLVSLQLSRSLMLMGTGRHVHSNEISGSTEILIL